MKGYKAIDELAAGMIDDAAMSRRRFLAKGLGLALGASSVGSLAERLYADCASGTGDPLPCLPGTSVSVNGFYLPKTLEGVLIYGQGRGMDGDPEKSEIVVATSLGTLLFYEIGLIGDIPSRIGDSPTKIIETGYNDVSGIAIAPDGYVISDGTNVRRGNVVETSPGSFEWQEHAENGTIALTGIASGTTDLDVACYLTAKTGELGYLIMIATANDGIRKLNIDGSSDAVAELEDFKTYGLGIMEWKPGTFDNPVLQYNEHMHKLDTDGELVESARIIDFAPGSPQGTVWTKDAFATLWGDSVALHNKWDVQQYLRGMPPVEYHPCDLDKDGDVDQDDMQAFKDKITGPNVPTTDTEKLKADYDGDNDIDQSDFGRMQRCFAGSGNAAPENCLD